MSSSSSSSASTDAKTAAWSRFCVRIVYFVPEVMDAMCHEMDDIARDVRDIAMDDVVDNNIPYEDMMYFCVQRVNSRGYKHFSGSSNIPKFPDFDYDLRYRAQSLVSHSHDYNGVDTYAIVDVVQEFVDYYLLWCKRIIFDFWSDEEIEFFSECLDETDDKDCNDMQMPLLFPVKDGIEIRDC